MNVIETDCLIIGSGLAGCAAAMRLIDKGIEVIMLTREKDAQFTASALAQGGIAFWSEKDKANPHDFIDDIVQAGSFYNNLEAVRVLVQQGPDLIQQILIDRFQVPFQKNPQGHFSFTEEAAHSTARILFHGDETGKTIIQAFHSYLEKSRKLNVLTQHTAIDLLTLSHHSTNIQDLYKPQRCAGAYVLNQQDNQVITILAKETILATGGLGQLYLHTTNPQGARGDGLAMAYRTGARIMNLEYIQFHPTALYQKTNERYLISETLRGEGGRLINHKGESFMHKYDSKGDLATRDVVSRAIHDELLQDGSPCVYLDISQKPGRWIMERFPSAYRECKKRGIDITKDPIPVVPAAHYSCGGIAVDDWANTTIRNLKAVGEVACTGVHGANRLASTSLLENLVWGVRAGDDICHRITTRSYDFPQVKEWNAKQEPIDKDLLLQDWLTIKHTMWNYVGLIRTPKRFERAQRIIRELAEEVEKFYANTLISDELIGLRNGAIVAQLILTAARRNTQSIGCHFVKND